MRAKNTLLSICLILLLSADQGSAAADVIKPILVVESASGEESNNPAPLSIDGNVNTEWVVGNNTQVGAWIKYTLSNITVSNTTRTTVLTVTPRSAICDRSKFISAQFATGRSVNLSMECSSDAPQTFAINDSAIYGASWMKLESGEPCEKSKWCNFGLKEVSLYYDKWTTCLAGERVTVNGTATSDRQCGACGAQTFTSTTNQQSCTTWTNCLEGERVYVNGTATSDRQCTACGAQTFTSTTNQQSCTPWTNCLAGERVSVNGTATADRQCGACVSSYNNGTNEHSCTPWTNCLAGEEVTQNGTATADRQCGACGAETFTSTANQQSCTPWTNCLAGERVSVNGTATVDRQCDACVSSYNNGTNEHSCTPWTNCSAGEMMTQEGTSTTDRQCAAEAETSVSIGTKAVATTATVVSSLLVVSSILGTF